jgi:hypothetical protein
LQTGFQQVNARSESDAVSLLAGVKTAAIKYIKRFYKKQFSSLQNLKKEGAMWKIGK